MRSTIWILLRQPLQLSHSEKMHLNIKAKERIGKAAAEMISPRDVILFDSGSTTVQIIKQMPADLRLGASIRMVTNSLAISQEVLSWPSPNLIILGGIYLPDYQATAGPQTLNQLQNLNCKTQIFATLNPNFNLDPKKIWVER